MITEQQKQRWVQALRSGEYRQCVGRLKNGGKVTSYCCLGVAQELFPDEAKKPQGGEPGTISHEFVPQFQQSQLMYMNDSRCPFPKIADWIEKNVEAK